MQELAKKGIDYVSYADYGLLHGDVEGDYGAMMQELLDSKNVGAIVHKDKSKWVKKDGVWLGKLKFVGLIYDPAVNLLSACTRGGATLDLSINTLALVDKNLPFVSPWKDSRNHLPLVDFHNELVQDSIFNKLVDFRLTWSMSIILWLCIVWLMDSPVWVAIPVIVVCAQMYLEVTGTIRGLATSVAE